MGRMGRKYGGGTAITVEITIETAPAKALQERKKRKKT